MNARCLTVMVIAVLLVAACSGGDTPAAPSGAAGQTIITFAAPDGLFNAYQDLAVEFEAIHPDVHAQVVSLDEILGPDLRDSVSPEAALRVMSAADTAYWYVRPAVTRQGLVRDLIPFLDADPQFDAADFYPGLLEVYNWDGGIWAVPGHAMVTLLFYDKAAFDEAGVPYPKAGWTWDDFVTTARAVTERDGGEISRYGYVDLMEGVWGSYLVDHGILVEASSTDPSMPRLDSPAVAAALHWYVALVHTYRIVPELETGQEGLRQAYALLADRRAAMWTDFASNHPSHPSGASVYAQREIGVVPFPSDGQGNTSPVQAFGYVMSAGTTQPEAAWRWLSFLTRQGAVGRTTGVAARRSVAEGSGFWDGLDDDLAEALRYALEHSLVSKPAGMTPQRAALEQALVAVLEEGQDIEQALAEVQQAALTVEAEAPARAAVQVPPVPPLAQAGDEVVTITFSTSFRDPALYRALAEQFHAMHPSIKIEVRPFTFSGSSGTVGIEEMAAAADCFRFTTRGWITPEEAQHLLSLDPFLNAEADFPTDDYYPTFLQMCQQEGQLWCLPFDGRVGVVRYNKALFDAAGIAYPEANWTLDDLVAKALALTRGEGADKQYGFSGYTNEEMTLEVMLRLRGGTLWDTMAWPPWPQYDDPAVVDAVRWYAGLADVDGIRPVVHLNLPWDQWMDEYRPAIYLVEGGKVAMWTQFADTDPHLQRAIPSMGTVPFPQHQGLRSFMSLVEAHYISAYSEHPQACWDWLIFLASHTAAVQGMPTRRSLAESAAFEQQVGADVVVAVLAALPQADLAPQAGEQARWMGRANHWFRAAYDAVLDGSDAAQALGEAQRKAEAYALCLKTRRAFDDDDLALACAREVDPDYPLMPGEE